MKNNSKIRKIQAREILDSRGIPTVEAELITDSGIFSASVPSGASKGKHEALELRDGGKRYFGMGVLEAVDNINKIIGPKLKGNNPMKQKEIDELMINLDGTENKSRLGANAILAVSMAVCRAGAAIQKLPPWKWISKIAGRKPTLPTPSILLIEGGVHAGNKLDIQEFMIVPLMGPYKEKLRIGTEIYHTLGGILEKKYGKNAKNVGLEGGFAAPLKKTKEALDLITEAIKKAGYENKIKITLDIAASSFFEKGTYKFEEKKLKREDLLNFYLGISKNYPIISLEDPFAQDDWQGWQLLKSKIKNQKSKILIIGDDLLVTNKKRIEKAVTEKACNGLLLKLNQIGTVSETIEAAEYATQNGWKVMVSQRGGETCDDFYADLCVGLGTGWIKTGAPTRGERVAKYNRLLRIEEELNKKYL